MTVNGAININEVPTVYRDSVARAIEHDPDYAELYLRLTRVGDPLADAAVEEDATIGGERAHLILRRYLNEQDDGALKDSPPALREFLESQGQKPDWYDPKKLEAGVRLFHRESAPLLTCVLAATLLENLSTQIAKSFFLTGRVRDNGVRRLRQNIRYMIEIYMPNGLEDGNDGWKLSIRTRLIHAKLRYLFSQSDEWETENWGIPLSSANMIFGLVAFSARLIDHVRRIGVRVTPEERESYVAVWRYAGYLIGIPEEALPDTADNAIRMFDIGCILEPEPGIEAIAMTNSVVNSGPLLIGKTEIDERKQFAKFIYRMARALIGHDLANDLHFPKFAGMGVLHTLTLQHRLKGMKGKMLGRLYKGQFESFTNLIGVAMYEDSGISYNMPDKVYAEQTTPY